MSRFLRLVLISGSHSINLPHLQSFTFGSSPPCSGCSPLSRSPSLLPVPFPSTSSSGSPSCRVTLVLPAPEADHTSPPCPPAENSIGQFSWRSLLQTGHGIGRAAC